MCREAVARKWMCVVLMLSLLGGKRESLVAAAPWYEQDTLTYMVGDHSNVFLRGFLGGVLLLFLTKAFVNGVWKLWLVVREGTFADLLKRRREVLWRDLLLSLCWGEVGLLSSSMYIIRFGLNRLSRAQEQRIFSGDFLSGFLFPVPFLMRQDVGVCAAFWSGYLQAYHFFFALLLVPFLFEWLEKLPMKGIAAISDVEVPVTEGVKVLLGGAFFFALKRKDGVTLKVMMRSFGWASGLVSIIWMGSLVKGAYSWLAEMPKGDGGWFREGIQQEISGREVLSTRWSLPEEDRALEILLARTPERELASPPKGWRDERYVLLAVLLIFFAILALGSFYFIRRGRNF